MACARRCAKKTHHNLGELVSLLVELEIHALRAVNREESTMPTNAKCMLPIPHSGLAPTGSPDVENDFEAWANVSARLHERSDERRQRILKELGIVDVWSAADSTWTKQLVETLATNGTKLAERYAAICAAEMKRRDQFKSDPETGADHASTGPSESFIRRTARKPESEQTPAFGQDSPQGAESVDPYARTHKLKRSFSSVPATPFPEPPGGKASAKSPKANLSFGSFPATPFEQKGRAGVRARQTLPALVKTSPGFPPVMPFPELPEEDHTTRRVAKRPSSSPSQPSLNPQRRESFIDALSPSNAQPVPPSNAQHETLPVDVTDVKQNVTAAEQAVGWSVEGYARYCAQLESFPNELEAIAANFGLEAKHTRDYVASAWDKRLGVQPRLKAEFRQLVKQYAAQLGKRRT
jgi:hypothetical protein